MRKIFFLLSFMLAGGYDYGQHHANKSGYMGPNVLGSFHIDRLTTIENLLRVLGNQSPTNNHYCFHNGTAYLWFEKKAHQLKNAGDVFLSSFPNCMDCPTQITSEIISDWKTEKMVGIGSTAGDVLAAYGKPLKDVQITGTAFRSLIQGDYLVKENRYAKIKRPELGEHALIYGSSDDLRSAGFGIRQGKVVWISLSNTE
jgi:hypothetical protein